MTMAISRRELLRALTSAVAVLALPGIGCAPPDDPALRAGLLALPEHERSWAAIGHAWLSEAPSSLAKLTRLLAADLEWRPGNPQTQLEDELRRRIRTDFDDGRVATVRGWVISLTEARLAGLVALSTPTP